MFDEICEVISQGENLPMSEIFADNRKGENVYARQLIAYFSREYGVGSLHYIGKKIGKDHATVMSGVDAINNYLDTDRVKKENIEKYRRRIDRIKMLQNKQEDMDMIIAPLKNEITALETRLLNIQVMTKNIIDHINELYSEKA